MISLAYCHRTARLFSLVVIATVAVSITAIGQTVSAPPAAAAAPEADETVQLTPFEVRGEMDIGYLGLDAASGSRLNSRISDTPASLSVFTAEFLQDIGATSVDDLAKYSLNTDEDVGFVSALPNGNSLMNPTSGITARGLPTGGGSASGRTVNFFSYNFEIDTYNIERVEFSRGPNAILFGIGQAGGSFNTQSRNADVRRRIASGSFRFGSYEAARTTLDVNLPVVKDRLALRVDGVSDHKNGWRPWEYQDNDRVYLALRYQLAPRTTVDVQSERAQAAFLRPRPYLGPDHISDWIRAGRPTSPNLFTSSTVNAQGLRRVSGVPWWVYIEGEPPTTLRNFFNMGRTNSTASTVGGIPMIQDFSLVPKRAVLAGPGPGNDAKFSNNSVFLRHEFTRSFFAELAATRQMYHSDQRDINGPDMVLYFDPNENLWNLPAGGPASIPNPNVGRAYVENYMQKRLQADRRQALRATFAYSLELGKWFGRHLLAGMGEKWEQKSWNTTYTEQLIDRPAVPNAPENTSNYIYRRTYVDLAGPVELIGLRDFRHTDLPGVGFVPKSAPTYNRYYINAWMLATQSRFWKDRVVITTGARHDYLYSKLSTSVRGGNPVGGYTVGLLEAGPASTNHVEGSTLTKGVVFHATPWLSLLANFSNNFALPAFNQRTIPGVPVPQPRGETEDFGVQLNLLQNRITVRTIFYQTEVQNNSASISAGNVQDRVNIIWNRLATLGSITSARRDEELVNVNAYNYDNSSKGWEGEIIANVTPSWRLMANLSTNETSWTNVGNAIREYMAQHRTEWTAAPDAAIDEQIRQLDAFVGPRFELVEGTLLQSSPKWSGNLRTNYTVREGWLKGVSGGAGVRWRSGKVLGYTSDDPATRQPIRDHSYTLADLNVGYRSRLDWFGRNVGWSVQLNVNNLFDNQDLIWNTAGPDGSLRTYRFQSPREWYLTTTLNF